MSIETKQNITMAEWLHEFSKPKRFYYQVLGGGGHINIGEEGYKRAIRIWVDQGRKERSPVHIVLCPESNCKILIQSNGGKRGAKLGATWKK